MRSGKAFFCYGLFAVCLMLIASPAISVTGGPVILMGIDAEDANGASGGSHGGKTPYISVLDSFLMCVNNGGSGILVIGGGKNASDDVTGFWNAIAAGVSPARTVTYVNGAANIAAQSFAGFEMIAVASSQPQTLSGGLTDAENTALAGKAGAIASFVNGGGGLFGLSQQGLSIPQYAYLGTVGTFTFNFPSQFNDITATAAGLAVGITNTNMDVCCWHDEYIAFPTFLNVLATNNNTGNASAVGGCQVVIQPLVNLDIKPTSCPNPLNIKPFQNDHGGDNAKSMKGGVLPVAILGTDDFDVHDVDKSSLLLNGVEPIRCQFEDVSTPVPPNGEDCECTREGPDGLTDLTIKFKKAEIVASIGAVEDGEVVELCLTGNLKDGTDFEVCDCVIIRGPKDNQPNLAGPSLVAVLDWATPNPFNPVTTINYNLDYSMQVRIQVFDIRGKLIDTLVNGVQSGGGHSVTWRADGLASGIYFYRMEAAGLVQTKRMTLLK